MKLPKLGKTTAAAPARASNGASVSVWVYGLLLALAALAVVLGTATWNAQRLERIGSAAEARLTERTAQLLAARLQQRIQNESASLLQVSQQPRLITALQARDANALENLGQEYQAAFPGALRLLVLPAGISEPNLQAQPPIGYALLDLMRKAEQERKAPPVEVHLPGQPAAHVNLLQPVLGPDSAVLGHLVATFPVKYLQAVLTGLDGGGLALQQGGTTVLQVGGTGGPGEQRLPVAGTRWQLVYAPAAAELAAGQNPWLVPGMAALALALLIVAATALLRRQIVADAGQLACVLHDLAEDALHPEYPVRLKEFGPAAANAFIDARRIQERLPVVAVERGARADTALSGLEVHETPPPAAPQAPAAKAAAQPRPAAVVPAPVIERAPLPADAEQAFEMIDEIAPPVAAVTLDPTILRAYDIRGIVGSGLTAEAVHALGRAIGAEAAAAGQQEIVVARDGRLSSPELSEALIAGLVASGRQVLDIGRVPTPVMNFATFHLGTGAGVMVTGSHNPRDYNGLKIVIGGRTLSGESIQALGRRVAAGDFVAGEGSVRRVDVLPDYVDRIAQDAALHRPLRIVVDCGNGVAGEVAPQVYRAMGCEVEELFCEVDGYFPNHHPDPTVAQNLDALISLVRLHGADVGLAFDGDGDRLGVVDAKGRIIWADRQLMLFAREVLPRHPGADIVFDVKCSAKLAEVITESAGVPVMWKSGHSMIKGKLAELGAPLGGEMSGHIFFKDRWYGFDDAIYAGARLLEILSIDPRGSVEVFAELPDALATPEIRVDLAEGEPEALMQALEAAPPKDFQDARLTTLDGIRADFPDRWGLVRASNTQPCLVLRFEAESQAALERVQDQFRGWLLSVRPDLELPF